MARKTMFRSAVGETSLRLIDRQARKLGSMTDSEHMLDTYSGKFVRFFAEGRQSSEEPRSRMPIAGKLVTAAYTALQMIFLGQRFAVNCPLVALYRVEASDSALTFLFTSRPSRWLSMIELDVSGAEGAASEFRDKLIGMRDLRLREATIEAPEQRQQVENFIRTVEAYDLDQILDLVLATDL